MAFAQVNLAAALCVLNKLSFPIFLRRVLSIDDTKREIKREREVAWNRPSNSKKILFVTFSLYHFVFFFLFPIFLYFSLSTFLVFSPFPSPYPTFPLKCTKTLNKKHSKETMITHRRNAQKIAPTEKSSRMRTL